MYIPFDPAFVLFVTYSSEILVNLYDDMQNNGHILKLLIKLWYRWHLYRKFPV
jgi:hypothetical protein